MQSCFERASSISRHNPVWQTIPLVSCYIGAIFTRLYYYHHHHYEVYFRQKVHRSITIKKEKKKIQTCDKETYM